MNRKCFHTFSRCHVRVSTVHESTASDHTPCSSNSPLRGQAVGEARSAFSETRGLARPLAHLDGFCRARKWISSGSTELQPRSTHGSLRVLPCFRFWFGGERDPRPSFASSCSLAKRTMSSGIGARSAPQRPKPVTTRPQNAHERLQARYVRARQPPRPKTKSELDVLKEHHQ